MSTQESNTQPQVTEEVSTPGSGVVTAALVGSILGGLVGGGALYGLTQFHLAFVGAIVGVPMPAAFGVWMGLAVGLGLVFATIASPAINVYTAAITWVTARVGPLRKLLGPLMRSSPLAAAASGVGLLYGALMGGAVGAAAVPAIVGGGIPPAEWTSIIAGYAIFGLVLGLGYGLTLDGTIPIPSFSFISPTVRASVFAPILAAAVSGAIVYTQDSVYLLFLGAIPGYTTPEYGFGIWVGLLVVLGLLFVALARGHANRGNGTTGYGVVYGIVLAVFVGLLAIPAAATAATGPQVALDFGDVSGITLGAFVVYGLLLGSVFGKTINRQPLRPTFLVGRTRATVVSSLIAGAVSGAVIYVTRPVAFFYFGFPFGYASVNVGLGIWIGFAVLLGLGFAMLPARRVERKDYPGQTGLKIGALYGLVVVLPLGLVFLTQVIQPTVVQLNWNPAPLTSGPVLGGYVLFGILHGFVYGGIKGSGRLTPVFLQGRGMPVVAGGLLGGAAGAAVIQLATPGFYFIILGNLVGAPSLEVGIAIWLALCLLLAIVFVPLGARSIEARIGLVSGLGVGAVYGAVLAGILGVIGIPAVAGLQMPNTNLPVVAYFVFGIVLGGTYGILRKRSLAGEERPAPTTVGTSGQRAIVFGSLFGGSVGGLIIHHMVGPVAMRFFAALVGRGGSPAVGWVVWLTLCLLLGTMFAVAVGPRLGGYARSVDEFTERDEDVDAVFGDFLDRAPITTTATVAGFVYGIVAAIAVGALAFPIAINAITGPNVTLASPILEGYFLLAFVVYGLIMGMGYGVMKEF